MLHFNFLTKTQGLNSAIDFLPIEREAGSNPNHRCAPPGLFNPDPEDLIITFRPFIGVYSQGYNTKQIKSIHFNCMHPLGSPNILKSYISI